MLYWCGTVAAEHKNSLGNARLSLCLQHIIQSCQSGRESPLPGGPGKNRATASEAFSAMAGVHGSENLRICITVVNCSLQTLENFQKISPHPGCGGNIQLLPAGVNVLHLGP